MGRRRWLVLVLLLGGVSSGLICSSGRLVSGAQLAPKPEVSKGNVPLASGVLRDAVEKIGRGESAAAGVDVVGDKIRVEVIHTLGDASARQVVEKHGGTVEGQIKGLVQALVPIDQLAPLEAEDGVRYLRPPLDANIPIDPPVQRHGGGWIAGGAIVGQEVQKTNADDWHAAGYTGSGVKVGIIDYFDDTLWNNAQAAGELPAPSGIFCRFNGSACDIWSAGVDHGEGVGEIIHEMAPDAQLFLATVLTTTDLQAAETYFSSQGVDVISRSLGSQYDGPGDGTGPIATVIDNAVADGMAWMNSAGNSAGDPLQAALRPGGYWRGQWMDADADGWLNFPSGGEYLEFTCDFSFGVRWNDFAEESPTDYDLYIYEYPGDPFPRSSTNRQSILPPIEWNVPCEGDPDYLAIWRYSAGAQTSDDIIEFMVSGSILTYWQNSYSAGQPASDSSSPGALSVGAVEPPLGTAIAYYSAQGPTNDGRTKPDISAASCVSSFTYVSSQCPTGGSGFAGTSAAAPAAAGAAALLIDAGVATTPAEIKSYLLSHAVERDVAGADNVFGAGELILPSPPSGSPSTPTPSPVATNTPTPTATSTSTPVDAPTPTSPPTATATLTATPSSTSTPTLQPSATPTATFTATRTPTRTPTPMGVRGDANCSGSTGTVDAALILQLDAGRIQSVGCPQNADVNHDGRIGPVDAALILQLDAGIIDALPAGN